MDRNLEVKRWWPSNTYLKAWLPGVLKKYSNTLLGLSLEIKSQTSFFFSNWSFSIVTRTFWPVSEHCGKQGKKDGGQVGLSLTPGMRDRSKSWIWSALKLQKSLLPPCNEFQKDIVALRVFKPWRFQLNHTCHTHTVSLMSLCKYLISAICITQPSLPRQPLLPSLSSMLVKTELLCVLEFVTLFMSLILTSALHAFF